MKFLFIAGFLFSSLIASAMADEEEVLYRAIILCEKNVQIRIQCAKIFESQEESFRYHDYDKMEPGYPIDDDFNEDPLAKTLLVGIASNKRHCQELYALLLTAPGCVNNCRKETFDCGEYRPSQTKQS